MSSDNSVNAAQVGYFYNRVGLKQGGVSQMSVKILEEVLSLESVTNDQVSLWVRSFSPDCRNRVQFAGYRYCCIFAY